MAELWAARFGSAAAFRRGWSVDWSLISAPLASREDAERELAYLRKHGGWLAERARKAWVEWLPPGPWCRWGGWVAVLPGLCACVGRSPEEALDELARYAEEVPEVAGRGRRRPVWVFRAELVAEDPGPFKCAFVRPVGKPRRVAKEFPSPRRGS